MVYLAKALGISSCLSEIELLIIYFGPVIPSSDKVEKSSADRFSS